MRKYKIVMLAYDPFGDILMDYDLTKEDAEKRLKEIEEKDSFHYFEIKEDD